jgi:transcriptional regulator with XRE-family HTH domain
MPRPAVDHDLLIRVSERITRVMDDQGVTAQELSYRIRVPVRQVYAWRGGTHLPSVPYLIELAEAFGVSTDYLLCLTDDRAAADSASRLRASKASATLDVLAATEPPRPTRSNPRRP